MKQMQSKKRSLSSFPCPEKKNFKAWFSFMSGMLVKWSSVVVVTGKEMGNHVRDLISPDAPKAAL